MSTFGDSRDNQGSDYGGVSGYHADDELTWEQVGKLTEHICQSVEELLSDVVQASAQNVLIVVTAGSRAHRNADIVVAAIHFRRWSEESAKGADAWRPTPTKCHPNGRRGTGSGAASLGLYDQVVRTRRHRRGNREIDRNASSPQSSHARAATESCVGRSRCGCPRACVHRSCCSRAGSEWIWV